jgi:RNA polymerase sigma-70 factor (ECF subfamily)
MLEDKMLLWKMKHGSSDALCRIYDRYKRDMLSLANALLHDLNAAEDIVHDVFISFIQSADEFKLTGSLKGYLLTCVANLSRDRIRARKREPKELIVEDIRASDCCVPGQIVISAEQLNRLRDAITELPFEQREVVVLHLQAKKTFKAIARLRQAPVGTIQSRYRYGLEKLRALLNSEVEI